MFQRLDLVQEEAQEEVQEEVLDQSSTEGDAGDGTSDEPIPEYLFKLFIADRGNSRVVVWNELPIISNEEDIDADEQIEVEDPNLLIGDDDYLDEEDEEGSSKELPSV